MVHSDSHDPDNEIDPREGPQKHDWKTLDKPQGFTARIIMPFFSTSYKTDVSINCILHCLSTSLPADLDPTSDHADSNNTALHLRQTSPLWKAPPIVRTWSFETFFSLYYIHLNRAAPLLFHHLRNHVYNLSEESYQQQFTKKLRPVDGLGFSGSLFFFTDDRSLIIKSVNRRFEYTFLYETMIDAVGDYFLRHNSSTLLSRITDVLYSFDHRLGGWAGVSPSHYVVMENVLANLDKEKGCRKWDLKPQNFFEPTRDLVPDDLKTEAAKSGLADELDEEIVLSKHDRDDLMALLEKDTKFLEEMGTIDYSLLLGRYPVEMFEGEGGSLKWGGEGTSNAGGAPPEERFVKGVRSGDGKWVYRMCVLDWLWNVDQLRPKVMRTAGKVLPEQTVTTEPGRYRKEFIKMMDEYITVV